MLRIRIPDREWYNEELNEFKTIPGRELELEHSLVSISEWESKYRRPFLDERNQMNPEELLDYIGMMCVPMLKNLEILSGLSKKNLEDIKQYIDSKPTATTYSSQKSSGSREIITSELIYCWMVQSQIPFSCETWNIHRLLTLINVVAIKNQPPKKMSQHDTLKQYAAINKARRAAHPKPSKPHI